MHVAASWMLGVAGVGAGAALAGGSGCASGPVMERAVGAAIPAAIVVQNLTPYRWRLTFRAMAAAERVEKHVEVGARDSAEVALVAGEFAIEQVALDGGGTGLRPRRFTMSFAAGERYEWALETLLTGGDGVRVRADR